MSPGPAAAATTGLGWRGLTWLLAPPLAVLLLRALLQAQAEAVNRALERQVRQCPQQYLWGYNRYKVPRGSPPGAAAP